MYILATEHSKQIRVKKAQLNGTNPGQKIDTVCGKVLLYDACDASFVDTLLLLSTVSR